MADYRVNLDVFAGPLDLLLHLVRKEEVDIYDIPIARITDQYIHYIEMLKSLDIDLAGDFLVMAATLMEIKSAMLLPAQDSDSSSGESQDLTDPRTELIRQLLEYKKFKDAANLLEAAAVKQGQRFARPDNVISQLKPDNEREIDIDQVSIWDLLEAFDAICKATGTAPNIRDIKDDTPTDLYQIEILHRLQTEGSMIFERVFESKTNRIAMIGLFLALLELVRSKLIFAEQPDGSSDIYLRPLTDEPAEQAVQKAIFAITDSSEAKQSKEPPIPIAELPPKDKHTVTSDKSESEKIHSAQNPSILKDQV